MSAVKSAKSIDYSNRSKLYDLYDSCLLDPHLAGVIDKRLRGVTRMPVEFQRDNQPVDEINDLLTAPWFKDFRKDVLKSIFYGFTLVQFRWDDDGNLTYQNIDRRHFDPIMQQILKYEFDSSGEPLDNFSNTIFIGSRRDIGMLAELVPAVLYKRGNISDWAQFCNIFGMPIREYTYDAGDEETRRRLIADAKRQGANAVYIHPKESELRFVEASKYQTGTSALYKSFTDYWDSQISIRVLGNTLTTDAKTTGTQALGTVHKAEEDDMTADDRQLILDVLNYQVKPVLEQMGFNIAGGEFVFPEHEDFDPLKQIQIVEKLHTMGLPMDDDYLYETFKVAKPANYDQLKIRASRMQSQARLSYAEAQPDLSKAEKIRANRTQSQACLSYAEVQPDLSNAAQRQALQQQLQGTKDDDDDTDEHKKALEHRSNADKTTLKNRFMSFFGVAPSHHGADSDW